MDTCSCPDSWTINVHNTSFYAVSKVPFNIIPIYFYVFPVNFSLQFSQPKKSMLFSSPSYKPPLLPISSLILSSEKYLSLSNSYSYVLRPVSCSFLSFWYKYIPQRLLLSLSFQICCSSFVHIFKYTYLNIYIYLNYIYM